MIIDSLSNHSPGRPPPNLQLAHLYAAVVSAGVDDLKLRKITYGSSGQGTGIPIQNPGLKDGRGAWAVLGLCSRDPHHFHSLKRI